MTFADAGQVRLVACGGVQVARCPPEGGQRAPAAPVIPHASRNHPASTGNPGHLPQACHRAGHEMHDQLRQGDVEGAMGEGQPLGRGQPDIHAGAALPHRSGERLRRVDSTNSVAAQPARQFGSQRARAAANIQGPLPAADTGQVGESHRERLRIAPHEPGVGVGADVETHPPNLRGTPPWVKPGHPPCARARWPGLIGRSSDKLEKTTPKRCQPIVRKIVATVVLTLAALAGPGLTTAEAAGAAGAAPKAPGASGVSAWGRATQAPQLVWASLPWTSQASAISGAQLWARRYTGSGNGISNDDLARSVAVSPSGDTIFVTGFSTGDTQDYATVAYNAAAGAQLWLKRYNGPAAGDDEAYSVAVSPSGETVFVTGYSAGATSGDDYVTVAYDAATGAQLWARRYNGPGNGTDHASSLAVSPRGDAVFVTGYSAGGTATGYDYATVAYNPATGAQLWLKRYNGPVNGDDAAASVTVSPGGDAVFVTGYSAGGAPTGNDYATVAYNPATGAQLWLNRYNGG